jgi:O-antigen/teichoic acid export membrane protein
LITNHRARIHNYVVGIKVRITRELLLVGLGQLVAFIGSILSVKFLTQTLPPEEYGRLALYLTATTLFQQVVFAPAAGAASRFYSSAMRADAAAEYLKAIRLLYLAALLVLALISVGLLIVGRSEFSLLSVTALALLVTFSGLNSVAASIQSAARQRGVAAFHEGASQWLRGGLGWLAIVLSGAANAVTALWGQAAASLFVLVSQGIFLVKLFSEKSPEPGRSPDGSIIVNVKQMVEFAWPYVIWGSLHWFSIASERWALGILEGVQAVGLYQVAYQIGFAPLSLSMSALQAFIAPILFERVGGGNDAIALAAAYRTLLRLAALAIGSAAFLMVTMRLSSSLIYRYLIERSYTGQDSMLPLAVLAAGLFSAGQFISLDYLTSRRSDLLIYPKCLSSGCGAIFAWCGASLDGPEGVLVASVCTNSLYLFLVWLRSPSRRAGKLAYPPQ